MWERPLSVSCFTADPAEVRGSSSHLCWALAEQCPVPSVEHSHGLQVRRASQEEAQSPTNTENPVTNTKCGQSTFYKCRFHIKTAVPNFIVYPRECTAAGSLVSNWLVSCLNGKTVRSEGFLLLENVCAFLSGIKEYYVSLFFKTTKSCEINSSAMLAHDLNISDPGDIHVKSIQTA